MALSLCSVQGDAPAKTDHSHPAALSLKETIFHGTATFPAAAYDDDIAAQDVLWHWHEEFETGIITAGSVRVSIAHHTAVLAKGDGFFINSGILHAMENACPGQPAALRSIVYHGSLVGGAAGSVYDTHYVLPLLKSSLRELILHPWCEDDAPMLACIRAAWRAMADDDGDFPLTVRDELSRLSALLIAQLNNAPVQNGVSPVQEERAQVMLAFLHRHYGESVTLADIAAAASVSVNEALRCAKQVLGLSPIQYLKKYRLARAAQQLRETTSPIADIASACGFPDGSYFAKSFREIYGVPPKAYRKEKEYGTI